MVAGATPSEASRVLSDMRLKFFTGKEKIRNRLFTHSLSWWHSGSRSKLCVAKIKCNEAIKSFLLAQRLDENPARIALDSLNRRGGPLGGLCRSCAPEAMAAYNSGRAKLFNELPSIFCGVQGWNALEDDF